MSFWFVFCQKCSHGGHLDHLVGWLKYFLIFCYYFRKKILKSRLLLTRTNPECPIMNCQCLCYISEGILDE